jgi:hypothetical protein
MSILFVTIYEGTRKRLLQNEYMKNETIQKALIQKALKDRRTSIQYLLHPHGC